MFFFFGVAAENFIKPEACYIHVQWSLNLANTGINGESGSVARTSFVTNDQRRDAETHDSHNKV